MEGAKPGHTVKFQGLKGAAHLNGTEGTLVKFMKKENRWSVRTDVDKYSIVKAKPENLILYRHYNTTDMGNQFASLMTFGHGGAGGGVQTIPVRNNNNNASADDSPASGWATGLTQKEQYEWFSNCYQMRCDDDYAWGGCYLHGPYDPDATPESIVNDFLVFCTLAIRAKTIPQGWDWKAYLKSAPDYIVFAFEKSDAINRWGSENYFNGVMGGRSLRYTGTKIYKSEVEKDENSMEHDKVEEEARANAVKFQEQLGGIDAWATLRRDITNGKRSF